MNGAVIYKFISKEMFLKSKLIELARVGSVAALVVILKNPGAPE
jgi:hypothetical protein